MTTKRGGGDVPQRKGQRSPTGARPCVHVYRGRSGWRVQSAARFYWRLIARNGEVVADGSQGYTRKADALKAARRCGKLMAAAPLEVEA